MDNLSAVESILDTYCTDKTTHAATIDTRYASLWQEIHHYLLSGGKRMRPQLVLLAYNAYGNAPNEGIASVAAAWELLHACLLVHDDIIDRDYVRHGKPNIAGTYQSTYSKLTTSGSEHYALSAALLGGDLLLMSAYEMITAAPLVDADKILALSYINKALFTVAGGELIDTDSALYPINASNPRSVAIHKTASYSLQMPLQCGAALAGASDEELEKLSRIGLQAGIAYQLRDDILGVFGDSSRTGKSNRSDIIEKKRTFLIHATLQNLSAAEVTRLTSLFAPDHTVSPQEAEEIVTLIATSGAKEATEQIINDTIIPALDVVETLSVDSSHKATLRALIEKLAARTS